MSLDQQDARQAIIDLTIAYCWAIDSHEWDTLRSIFVPEATALLGDERDGIESIIARISSALTPLDASQHIVSNHQVAINGDSATSRCYFQAQHVRRAAEGSPNYIVAGRYQDRLVRTAHGWRILRRDLLVDWTEGNFRVVRP
jgi:3-phenylpropionate/cinnamic acid dioxygenase small subunit